ncbi:hypothetical protein ABS315_07445 [Peribacillus frigoritolerans]|uniref:hypothetical protein n=1 Tax=Peribacillus frigoritolerans TaxID=450367 RepID=UPI0034E0966F
MQTLQHLSKHIAYLPPVQETDRPVLAAVTGKRSSSMPVTLSGMHSFLRTNCAGMI